MNIRPLVPSDAVVVHAHGSQEPAFRIRHDLPGFWSIPQLESWFASLQDICLGLFNDLILEAFILVSRHTPTNSARIENIWTLKEVRRMGHARQLLARALTILSEERVTVVTSVIGTENPSSFYLHRKHGFDPSTDGFRLMLHYPVATDDAA